tara:strand:+ start:178 stop:528 length:351 start_codon:yes stop_codon:yes gene_type:complete
MSTPNNQNKQQSYVFHLKTFFIFLVRPKKSAIVFSQLQHHDLKSLRKKQKRSRYIKTASKFTTNTTKVNATLSECNPRKSPSFLLSFALFVMGTKQKQIDMKMTVMRAAKRPKLSS